VGRFFDAHEASAAAAFVQVDFQRSWLAPFGAWMFHRTRMRLEISRHDGIRSVQRSHPLEILAAAATEHAPRLESWISGRRVRNTPLPCALNSLVGIDRSLTQAYLDELGPKAARLEHLA